MNLLCTCVILLWSVIKHNNNTCKVCAIEDVIQSSSTAVIAYVRSIYNALSVT
jgi:hypothetical protein